MYTYVKNSVAISYMYDVENIGRHGAYTLADVQSWTALAETGELRWDSFSADMNHVRLTIR